MCHLPQPIKGKLRGWLVSLYLEAKRASRAASPYRAGSLVQNGMSPLGLNQEAFETVPQTEEQSRQTKIVASPMIWGVFPFPIQVLLGTVLLVEPQPGHASLTLMLILHGIEKYLQRLSRSSSCTDLTNPSSFWLYPEVLRAWCNFFAAEKDSAA